MFACTFDMCIKITTATTTTTTTTIVLQDELQKVLYYRSIALFNRVATKEEKQISRVFQAFPEP